MDNRPGREWKHTTSSASNTHGEPIGLDFFDDEPGHEGQTAIYFRFADGTLWPARTVNMKKKRHAKAVITAWRKRKIDGTDQCVPVNDHRSVKLY